MCARVFVYVCVCVCASERWCFGGPSGHQNTQTFHPGATRATTRKCEYGHISNNTYLHQTKARTRYVIYIFVMPVSGRTHSKCARARARASFSNVQHKQYANALTRRAEARARQLLRHRRKPKPIAPHARTHARRTRPALPTHPSSRDNKCVFHSSPCRAGGGRVVRRWRARARIAKCEFLLGMFCHHHTPQQTHRESTRPDE